MTPLQLRDLSSRFEIGGHTFRHTYLTSVRLDVVEKEVVHGKRGLEDLLGCPVTSFAYPGGKYNRPIRDIVARSGFHRARTTRFLHLGRPTDIFQIHTTWICGLMSDFVSFRHMILRKNLSSLPMYARVRRLGQSWAELACRLFDVIHQSGDGIFHLWGHSWEIEQNNDWDNLEEVFEHVSRRSGVQYASNGAIHYGR